MQHKSARIIETPKINDWAKRTADTCSELIKGFNNMAYEDEPLEEYMVELVLSNIRLQLVEWKDEQTDEQPDDHLESNYSPDNYMEDGDALASAGWGTDEDYSSGEIL